MLGVWAISESEMSATIYTADPYGLECTMPVNRLHYEIPESRLHYTAPVNRLHYAIPEED